MLLHYLLTAFRNFKKNRFYLVLNVVGLAVGLACCLVVYTILKHEYTFDSWHKDANAIYRVTQAYQSDYRMEYSGIIPNPMPETLAESLTQADVIPMLGPVSTISFF